MSNLSVRLVFDRKKTATKKKQSSVQLEVTYQRKRKFIMTGVKLYSDQWDKDRAKVKNHPSSLLFNQQLSDKLTDIYEFAHNLETENIPFSFEKLDAYLDRSPGNSSGSFLEWMGKRIEERAVSEGTKARQRCVLKALREWGKIRDFSDITYPNIMAYDEFAHKRCKEESSVYNYHKILKTFVREAFCANLTNNNPYLFIKLDRGATDHRKFLSKEELETIETKDIQLPFIQRVRDLFLFCCYTGLAYSDLAKFDFSEARLEGGMYRIRDFRQKTGTQYHISLMDKAMAILHKYSFKLPIISLQKYNTYLKVLGAFCELKTTLTSHVARHTFATTVTMANGVRIEVISKMLGHTNIQTTQLYAKIYQSEVNDEFDRLNKII